METFFEVLNQKTRRLERLKFWKGQLAYLTKCRQRTIGIKSRRIGFSTVVQARHTTGFLFDGGDNLIVGDRYQTTKNVLSVAKRFLYSVRDSDLGPILVPEIGRDNEGTIEILHPRSGLPYKTITAFTAGRGGTRSFGGARLHETEQAFWERAEETDAAVLGSDEGNMIVDDESTPFGRANLFARRALDMPTKNDFAKVRLNWRANPNFTEAWARRKRRDIGPVLFGQEYDCDFVQSGNPVFDADLFRKKRPRRRVGGARFWEYSGFEDGERPFAGGADCVVGRPGGDNAVLLVVDTRRGEIGRDPMRQVAEIRGRFPPDVFAQKIDEVARRLPGRYLIEDNGPGEAVYLECRRLGTPGIRRYHTTAANKTTLIHRYEKALRGDENGVVEMEIYSGETIEEHKTFVYLFNERTGNVKLEALPPFKDDGVIAGALAFQAALTPFPGVVEE